MKQKDIPQPENLTGRQLQELLNRVEGENNSPIADFDGYPPSRMQDILHAPFEDGSAVSLRELPPEGYRQSPLYMTMKALAGIVRREGSVKLTGKGYLPPRIVLELYAMGYFREGHLENGYMKLKKESDSDVISIARMVLEAAGVLTKRRSGLTLSKKGAALLSDQAGLFRLLFTTFTTRFRWASLDDYGIEDVGQLGAAFSCVLLDKYGSGEMPCMFYALKYLNAFPFLMKGYTRQPFSRLTEYFSMCYCLRTFDRFFIYWGLAQYVPPQPGQPVSVIKTPLMGELIKCSLQ